MGSISNQLAELRNLFGTGHGKLTHHVGLEKRHAKLAVSAAATLALFLFESHDSGESEIVKTTAAPPTGSVDFED